jgi:superfamily II DNA or RNA helicase
MWPLITEAISGRIVFVKAERLVPVIRMIPTECAPNPRKWDFPFLSDMQRRAKLLSLLCKDETRNRIVAAEVYWSYMGSRKILVISDRKVQLRAIEKILLERGIDAEDMAFYTGGMKQSDLDSAREKDIIFTTYGMSKEGLDIPDLDCLVMASPQAGIEQTVGRILRIVPGKQAPLVYDFVDDRVEMLRGIAFGRLRQYGRLGYAVEKEWR